MNRLLSFLFSALFLTGCNTAYQGLQTPDDVYYSPQRVEPITARSDSRYSNRSDRYSSYDDDNYLRMRVQNRSTWCRLDDYSYWNDSRYYMDHYYWNGYNPYWNSWSTWNTGCWNSNYYCDPYNSFLFNSSWNNWNSPYCTVVYYSNPKAYFNGYSSRSNLTAYGNNSYNMPLRTTPKGDYYAGGGYRRDYNNSSLIRNGRPTRIFSTGNGSSSAGGRSGGFNTRSSTGTARRPPR